MATVPHDNEPKLAKTDALVDENGPRIEVPVDSSIRPAAPEEAAVASTGPTSWWLYGLVGLAIIIAVLFVLQLVSGAPSTDVDPGTPTATSVEEQVVDGDVPSP